MEPYSNKNLAGFLLMSLALSESGVLPKREKVFKKRKLTPSVVAKKKTQKQARKRQRQRR